MASSRMLDLSLIGSDDPQTPGLIDTCRRKIAAVAGEHIAAATEGGAFRFELAIGGSALPGEAGTWKLMAFLIIEGGR